MTTQEYKQLEQAMLKVCDEKHHEQLKIYLKDFLEFVETQPEKTFTVFEKQIAAAICVGSRMDRENQRNNDGEEWKNG